MNIILRPANINDLDLLKHWDTQQHVIDAGDDEDWNWEYELPRKLSWREMLIAELDNRPIGFIQIIDPLEEETHYWGTVAPNLRAIDIWIGEVTDLGKGYGTIMMRLAIEKCFAEPNVTAILIDPLLTNHRAIKFYKKLSFEFIENKFLDGDEVAVMKLERGKQIKKKIDKI